MTLNEAAKIIRRRADHLEFKIRAGKCSEASCNWMRAELSAINKILEKIGENPTEQTQEQT